MVTPGFNLSSDSRLVFWYRAEDVDNPQDLAVKIGSTVIYQISGATNTEYQEVQVLLAAYTGQTISISFVGETGTGGIDYGICLDDVMVLSNENNWTGNISTDWNDSGNWSSGFVPDLYDVVLIPSEPSGDKFPVIASGIIAKCYKITLNPGAFIMIQAGGFLNVTNQ